MSSSKGIRLRQTGFTLVEILIVIVAMAIIAGVVLPEFGSAVEDALAADADEGDVGKNFQVHGIRRSADDVAVLKRLAHQVGLNVCAAVTGY